MVSLPALSFSAHSVEFEDRALAFGVGCISVLSDLVGGSSCKTATMTGVSPETVDFFIWICVQVRNGLRAIVLVPSYVRVAEHCAGDEKARKATRSTNHSNDRVSPSIGCPSLSEIEFRSHVVSTSVDRSNM